MHQENKLLPCPFCGTKPPALHIETIEYGWLIHGCSGYCPASGGASGYTKEEAIARWNKRVSTQLRHFTSEVFMNKARTPDTSAKVDVEGFRRELNDLIVWCVNTRDLVPPTAQQMRYERAIRLCERLISALQSPRTDTSAVELVRILKLALEELRDDIWDDDISDEAIAKAEQWLKKVGK